MKYKKLVADATSKLKKNPVLLLPDIALFVITYLLTIALYWYSGLAEFSKIAMASGQKIDFTIFLKDFAQSYTTQIISSLAIFVFVTFFLGAGTEAIRFSMIKKVVLGGIANAKDMLHGRGKDFWRVVAAKMIIYLIALAIALCLMLLASFTFSLSNGLSLFAAWITVGLGIALYIILSIGFLFRYAIIFLDEDNAATAIRKSVHYLATHTRYVFKVWFIYMGIAISFTVIGLMLSFLFSGLREFISGATAVYLISFLSAIASFAIRMLYNVWAGLFIFECYNAHRMDK